MKFDAWNLPTRIPASRHKSKHFEILCFRLLYVVVFIQRKPEVAFEISRFEFLRRKPVPQNPAL
ncbi:hypothetical protein [uncultured Campylobacter sp.]|uniref:hypothetical protein n=1 Tax=uncultured Campylobacter sp. TaxID=218934 RepID=UPI00261A4548|nr:hypothetical protein [uncultured Campylobacter sp.]